MPRITPSSPTIYVGPSAGHFGDPNVLITPNYPTFQAAISDLKNSADLVGETFQFLLLDGAVDPGFTIYGEFVGQSGPSVVFRASQMGAPGGIIRPSDSHSAIGLAYGANIAIAELEMDGATQGSAGHPQDVVQLGQGAHLSLFGHNRVIQNSPSYNHFTVSGATIDQYPQSYGSPIQNGGHLHWQGDCQAGVQTDNFGLFGVNANGQHGLIAWWMEAGVGYPRPQWSFDFLDCGPGEIHIDGVDFHGTADGYAYRSRPGSILYYNQAQDPNQINAIPGSARNRGPIQGYLI